MKKIFLLFFFVSSINLIYAQENLTVNLIGNPDFETPIINLISSFDSVSIGKWSFFKCSGSIESAASLSTSMPYSGVNNALINVISNPSNNIWNALLFQDFQNMKPMKYEFSFRAKAGKVLQSGINISIIDKNTNTILKGFSEENFKFNADWGLYIVDLDLSSFKTSDLTNARISFHFSEVADYQIDDVKLRPIYVVPFVNTNGTVINSTGYLSFEKTINEFWCGNMAPSATVAPVAYSTESSLANFSVIGSITGNGALLRYTNFPSRGAKPLQGNRSLFVEVSEVFGTPDYEVCFQTPNFAPEVLGRKIRISYWAKTDGEATGEIRIQARFVGTNKDVAQLTPEWKYFSYEYIVPTSTIYPVVRLQFYKVGSFHVDWFNVEYADVVSGIATPTKLGHSLAIAMTGKLKIISDIAKSASVYNLTGQLLKTFNCVSNSFYEISSKSGIYLVKVKGFDNSIQTVKVIVP
jgi:hypothetical protein